MTNFAQWYAYYRNAHADDESAAGRRLHPRSTDTYRVGFITINPGSPVVEQVPENRHLRRDPQSAWYTKFYGRSASGGTPLAKRCRAVAGFYAGQFDGIDNGHPSTDDPMQYSCQPKLAILSTDGLLERQRRKKIDSSDMTQQGQRHIGPYSKRTDGVTTVDQAPRWGSPTSRLLLPD